MSGAAQLVTSGPLILALPVAAAAGAVPSSPASSSASAAGPDLGGPAVVVAAPPLAPPAAAPRARVVAGTALFVLGFSVVFVAYGAALGGLGHLLTGHARL